MKERRIKNPIQRKFYLLWGITLFLSLGGMIGTPRLSAQENPNDDFTGTTVSSKWTSIDLGDAAQLGGSATKIENDQLLISGSGSDIGGGGGDTDNCRFVYQKLQGDFIVTIAITSPPTYDPNAKAGLMIRQSDDPKAPMAFIGIARDSGTLFIHRDQEGESAVRDPGTGVNLYRLNIFPVWVRLIRRGDIITSAVSYNGTDWTTLVGGADNWTRIPLKDPVLVGPAVTSNNATALTPATFDDFTVSTPPTGTGHLEARVTLAGTDTTARGAFVMVSSPDGKVLGGAYVQGGPAMILDLPPGKVTVTATGKGFGTAKGEVEISAGKVAQINLSLETIALLDLSSEGLGKAGIPKWKVYIPGDDSSVADPNKGASWAGHPDYVEKSGDGVTGWTEIEVPGNWLDVNPDGINSFGWYRLKLTKLPQGLVGNAAQLKGFNVDDVDVTYVNGQLVGATGSLPASATDQTGYVSAAGTLRNYMIPPGLLKGDGKDVIAIRVYNAGGPGGITSSAPGLIGFPGGVIQGKVADASGNPGVGLTMIALSTGPTPLGTIFEATTTDSKGEYRVVVPPGTYSVIRKANPAYVPVGDDAQTGIVVAPGGAITANFTANPLPTVALSTQNGYKWRILLGPDVGPDDDYKDPQFDDSSWQEYIVNPPAAPWGVIDPTSRIYGWVRLRFKLPDSFKPFQGYDLRLYNFTFEDVETTYWNGVKIGGAGFHLDDPQDDTGFISAWNIVRDYRVPASAVNWDGDNVIAIDGFVRNSSAGSGGFSQKAPPLLTVIATSAPRPQGDLNGDNKVTITDAVIALQIAVGRRTATPEQLKAGDFNNNGKIEIADVIRILRIAVFGKP